jgi:hypothetical protein
MGIVGDLSRYTQFQRGRGDDPARRCRGRRDGLGRGRGLGMAMGAQMARQGPWGAARPPPPPRRRRRSSMSGTSPRAARRRGRSRRPRWAGWRPTARSRARQLGLDPGSGRLEARRGHRTRPALHRAAAAAARASSWAPDRPLPVRSSPRGCHDVPWPPPAAGTPGPRARRVSGGHPVAFQGMAPVRAPVTQRGHPRDHAHAGPGGRGGARPPTPRLPPQSSTVSITPGSRTSTPGSAAISGSADCASTGKVP